MNWGAPEWGLSIWTLPIFAILIVLALRLLHRLPVFQPAAG